MEALDQASDEHVRWAHLFAILPVDLVIFDDRETIVGNYLSLATPLERA